jgi:hypothetical protein
MNEKIKEIAVQAKIQMVSEPRLTEFAELLIKECIDSVNETAVTELTFTTYDMSMVQGTKQRCVKSIKEKFNIPYN